jgi:hydroxyacylglutathione hydrolase
VRRLREGDQVGGFTVLETPGVTPGHVSLWRESDRTLIAGEVLNNLHDQVPFATFPPHEPAAFGTADRWRNRASAKRLAALEPALVCFCHGPPLRDTRLFVRRAASLGD